MRKLLFIITVSAVSFILVSCSDDDNDQRINFSEIPETAKTFVKNHFADFNESDIDYVELDSDGSYEVKLKNKIEIDFYPNGIWKEIDMNGNVLPVSIAMMLSENALNYISTTYPNAEIEEIEKTGIYAETGQDFKIELRGDREIYFDATGNVLQDKGQSGQGKQTMKLEDLPEITQTFLNVYFAGQTPDKIEKEWNKYELEYNTNKVNEVEIEFFANDGSFKSIESERNSEVIRSVIQGVLGSTVIVDYLDRNYTGQTIEEFSIAASGITISKGYVVEIDGNPDYKVYFDLSGNHLLSIRD